MGVRVFFLLWNGNWFRTTNYIFVPTTTDVINQIPVWWWVQSAAPTPKERRWSSTPPSSAPHWFWDTKNLWWVRKNCDNSSWGSAPKFLPFIYEASWRSSAYINNCENRWRWEWSRNDENWKENLWAWEAIRGEEGPKRPVRLSVIRREIVTLTRTG